MIKTATYPKTKIDTIGIAGKKNTNKKLFASVLQSQIECRCERQVMRTGFAEPIYQTLISMFSPKLTWEHLGNKEMVVPGLIFEGAPVTGRMLLQKFGEFGRSFTPSVWVDRAFKHRLHGCLYIIHDVRLPDEAEAIIKNNGIIIRIEPQESATDNHITETALDKFDFPIVVESNGRESMQADTEEIVKNIIKCIR